MTPARAAGMLLIIGVLAAGGWWFFGRGGSGQLDTPEAHLTAHWHGRFQGTMTLPARLNWCPGSRRGLLEALSADSGLAVVLYERDSLTGGPHAVASPETSATIQPPGATVVLRWMRLDRDTAVTGFRSQSGTVRFSLTGGRASGDINTRMRSVAGNDTIVVQASFRNVPVVTTAAGCS